MADERGLCDGERETETERVASSEVSQKSTQQKRKDSQEGEAG